MNVILRMTLSVLYLEVNRDHLSVTPNAIMMKQWIHRSISSMAFYRHCCSCHFVYWSIVIAGRENGKI